MLGLKECATMPNRDSLNIWPDFSALPEDLSPQPGAYKFAAAFPPITSGPVFLVFLHALPGPSGGLVDKLQLCCGCRERDSNSARAVRKSSSREKSHSCCSTKPADVAEHPPLYGSRRGTKDTELEMTQISAWRAEAGGLLVAAQPSLHRLVRSGGLDLRLVPFSHLQCDLRFVISSP